MGYAFISYSSKNQATADAFRQYLERQGVKTWMAPYNIPTGSEYVEVLFDALMGCSCLVLLLSNAAQNSPWVRQEVNIAFSNNKPLIPAQLEHVVLNSIMKVYLNDRHIEDMPTVGEHCEGLRKVLGSIVACTGRTGSTHAPDPSSLRTRQVYPDGIYEGTLVNGKRHGKGKFTFHNGNVYEGDYFNDKRTGRGKFTWRDGDVYIGDYLNDKRTGQGTYMWKKGDIYTGAFVNGRAQGRGKRTCANGDIYEGEFSNDKLSGKGKKYYACGDVYEGNFVDGEPSGYGKFTCASGDIYIGDYVRSRRTGRGKYIWRNGIVYEGEFLEDKITGWGKMTWPSGTVRQGRFLDGRFIG